jgi:anti-anti-sigma regulatory factor
MLRWKVTEKGQGGTHVRLYGDITESTSFGELTRLGGTVVLDLEGVRHLNSIGVRELLTFVQSMASRCTLTAEKCSPVIVGQLNMLPEFSRHLTVRSLLVPLECPKCFEEVEVLVDVQTTGRRPAIPDNRCRCGTSMVLAELEDRYFAFLTSP